MISPDYLDLLLSLAEFHHFELIHELKYLKIYILCLAKWNDSSFGKDKNFGFLEESHIEATLEEFEKECVHDLEYAFQRWDYVATELVEKIPQCKPKIKEDCLNFLDCPFQCEFSIDELPEFMMCISGSLQKLRDLKADMDVKGKIESLEDNLDLFKEVLEFASKRCSSHEDLKDFKTHVQTWACIAACLSLLYWVLDVQKENMAARMDVILSDLQKKISPSIPEVTRMYLAVLKASKPSAEDSLTVSKLVLKFVKFVKANLQVDPEKDGIQMLFIGLIFLITFLMDRPQAKNLAEGTLILTKADVAVNEAASLISSLSSGEIKLGIAEERNFLLPNFLDKVNAIKTEVRRIYAHLFPDPSSFNFPRINVLGFIDSLLENLKEFCFHFPKHQIVMLQKELLSLKQSKLKDLSTLGLQKKHKDIENLWTRIVNVAHNAERAINSFIYIKKSLWHDILCLSDVIEEIKLIMGEMMRIQEQNMYDIHAVNSEMSSNSLLPLQANIPAVEKVVVGFKDEVKEILDRLKSGSTGLDIISIVGMPGLGKTTLAKKVYSHASVQFHFNKWAWCIVSQTFDSKRMLLDIVSDLDDCDRNELLEMEEEDLAQRVYRSLKGHRYLIVMDDIWDVRAWYALKMSFPDDDNGSRIMFTSRIHNVVLEAKSGCSPFPLNPLSEEESWELLEKRLFYQDSCPPDFVDFGRQIATNCKGLPLTIVLVAGILKRRVESLDWWKEVRERLDSLIAKEGCTDILELSYKHLPELLKPCFIYFGSFAEDEEIRVKKLILLWISEGFIQKHEIKSLEAVAEEYLMDLVARSLVIVTKRSSTGMIKACLIHDLLHDFCLAKGKEEKVLKVIHGEEVSYHTSAHYWVRIQTECWRSFLEHDSSALFVHSLLPFHSNEPNTKPTGNLEPNYIHCLTSHFKFLHVLNLDLNLPVVDFPEGITELVLLRYLSISCDSDHIPPSIKRLENLEILTLHSWKWLSREPFKLPLTMWEMQKLRHVHASLVRIPPHFCDDIPPLENVRAFSNPILPYREESEIFLRKIPHVQKLKCAFELSDPSTDCILILKLDFLSHLESLNVDHIDREYGKLYNFAFHFPPTLKKLTLGNFRLPWSKISVIAELPNLEVLKLYNAFCGETWEVGDAEFLHLKFLKLINMDIEQLVASDGSFPCLENLLLDYCFNLEEIPSIFGSVSTLKVIEVEHCKSILNISLKQIQEEQVELGNEDLEVLISNTIEESLGDSNLDS